VDVLFVFVIFFIAYEKIKQTEFQFLLEENVLRFWFIPSLVESFKERFTESFLALFHCESPKPQKG
jgi:hypothetical protein